MENHIVAVKTIKETIALADFPALVIRFMEELSFLSRLRHDRIIRLYGFVERPYCLVMEYANRGSLKDLLHSDVAISNKNLLKIAIQIAEGVAYLHSRRIYYRDLKSMNVLITDDFDVKLCDFGVSKCVPDDSGAETVVGSPFWMAPEVQSMNYTSKIDVYSYGIILWELWSRKTPYSDISGYSVKQIMYKVSNEGLRPQIPEKCPETMCDLMKKCWDDNPDERPTFKDILEDLEKLKNNVVFQ